MADQARKKTDKILSDMEKQLYKEYNRAADEITKKWYNYMQSHEKTLKSDYEALMSAKKSGDKEEIRKAKEKYEKTMKNITLNNDRYNAMLNETTAKLSHVNEVATNYVNDNMAKIYTLNYNAFANEDITGYTFTLVNENAVKNLATKDKLLLPKKKVDVPKDKAWNKKNINSELIQGILQGESVSKISKRLVNVVNMNEHSSIRNARTMVTSAENKGKLDSFKKAEDDGVVLTREWVATPDERTRAWHAALDGVAVKVDQPWVNEYGEIMYPGDPDADPCNVYNCRCTMRGIVQGFNWSKQKIEVADEFLDVEIDPDKTIDIFGKEYTHDEIMDYVGNDDYELLDILSNVYSEEELMPLMDGESFDRDKLEQFLFGNPKEIKEDILETQGELLSKVVKGDEVPLPIIDDSKPSEEGLELYAGFINAGDYHPRYDSADIHTFAGYNPYSFGDYDASRADISKLRELDTVFSAAENEGVKYKGTYFTQETMDKYGENSIVDHTYSSTTANKNTTHEFAGRAYDVSEVTGEEYYPVYETIHIEDGVPIANTIDILGKGGMRSFEQETTIGRETVWEYSKFVKHEKQGEVYYTVDVTVRRRRKNE